ncbi:hypothetical protein BLX24_23780 [Arsenicibacter rosenii]|uniref:Uncharacterized protein n=1 Tax=Arsenicibacter rosenii TaxID=1750698 RepID=A0A1S2VD82_9BACT|nr:hypothetical protein BLX24_23780 [Arsenicibacter rosenii]
MTRAGELSKRQSDNSVSLPKTASLVVRRQVVFPDVIKSGTYTLTVYSGNCVVTQTVAVTGTACP